MVNPKTSLVVSGFVHIPYKYKFTVEFALKLRKNAILKTVISYFEVVAFKKPKHKALFFIPVEFIL
jgi:hypothetical protein